MFREISNFPAETSFTAYSPFSRSTTSYGSRYGIRSLLGARWPIADLGYATSDEPTGNTVVVALISRKLLALRMVCNTSFRCWQLIADSNSLAWVNSQSSLLTVCQLCLVQFWLIDFSVEMDCFSNNSRAGDLPIDSCMNAFIMRCTMSMCSDYFIQSCRQRLVHGGVEESCCDFFRI